MISVEVRRAGALALVLTTALPLFSVAQTPINRSEAAQARQELIRLKFEFVKIVPGQFTMGCSKGDAECDGDETPPHLVRMTKRFEIGRTEVTQEQWETLMGDNPSHFRGADLPVENVSWNDIQDFLGKMNARNDGYLYRLPTEAEWEYAARARTKSSYPATLDMVAWDYDNSGHQTHDVALKQSNAWGLYDVIGNVWELVQDWYDPNYYASSPERNPNGPATGTLKVLRGGSWYGLTRTTRVSFRGRIDPAAGSNDVGFRCVRVLAHS